MDRRLQARRRNRHDPGRPVTTLDGLEAILGRHFRLVGAPLAVPFVIRETRRKFQHTLSEATVWERMA